MIKEIVIRIEKLSKLYRLYDNPKDRLKESLHPFNKKYHHDFFALKDVSFEIEKGETLGIIGRNGSGKSTLLKILSGVLTQSNGSYHVSGRVSSLLELGTGFNPELTGIENVYFNGAILGYTKAQMEEKLEDILSFADIGEFIHQPVKMYSSGMYVRLAFAVAINVNPDVLIIDEALAVGDIAFQMKCTDRIRKMIDKGITLLFVSHDPGAVKRLCNRAILLERGKLIADGSPEEVFDLYNAMIADEDFKNTLVKSLENGKVQVVSGTGEVRIDEIFFIDENRIRKDILEVGEPAIVHIRLQVLGDIEKLVLGFMIKDRLGQVVYGTNTFHTNQVLENVMSGTELIYKITFPMNIGPGNYSLTVAATSTDTHLIDNYVWMDFALIFSVTNVKKNYFAGLSWLDAEFQVISSGVVR